jgi:hypothetical protein
MESIERAEMRKYPTLTREICQKCERFYTNIFDMAAGKITKKWWCGVTFKDKPNCKVSNKSRPPKGCLKLMEHLIAAEMKDA